jgi:hypothetical protein
MIPPEQRTRPAEHVEPVPSHRDLHRLQLAIPRDKEQLLAVVSEAWITAPPDVTCFFAPGSANGATKTSGDSSWSCGELAAGALIHTFEEGVSDWRARDHSQQLVAQAKLVAQSNQPALR